LIVLDTAVWIWLSSEPGQLSEPARAAIEAHNGGKVSAISAWEVGMLVSKGRIRLDRPVDRWTDEAMRSNGVDPVPVDHRIGALATLLPGDPPTDRADRLIIATALHEGGAVVTPDRHIREYPFCPTIW
jgi:PIN domain nuclease of toxin-antitoxin system